MKKTLLNTQADLTAWLNSLLGGLEKNDSTFGCLEDIESYFGIDLLDEAGQDFDTYENTRKDDEPCLWEAAMPVQYRVREPSAYAMGLPESLPCLAVSWFEETADRLGDVTIRCLEYVYPADFQVA